MLSNWEWVGSTFLDRALIKPLYAILIDRGFMTKKLFGQFARLPEADDIVAECDRIMALPCLADYELLRVYFYDVAPRKRP